MNMEYSLRSIISTVQLLSHVWLFVTPWTAACQASLSITNSWSLLKLMSIESVMPSNHFILAIQETLKSLLQHHSSKASILWRSVFFIVQLSHPYMTTGKTIALTSKVMSLLFNMLSSLVIAFLPRGKYLNFMAAVTICTDFRSQKKIKSLTVSIVFLSTCHEVMGLDVMILVFWILSFKPAFSLSSFTYIKRLFSSSSLSAIRVVVSPACLGLLIFLLAILILACASSNPEFLMIYSAYHMLIDHVLSKKISFNKSKIEIISSIFSNHKDLRLEITHN